VGKFDQVLERAKANGLIEAAEGKHKVGKHSSSGDENEADLIPEPLVEDMPMELADSKRAPAEVRGAPEPETQKGLGISAVAGQGASKKSHAPLKEETEKTVAITDRETIAKSLDSLRVACSKDLPDDSAKEYTVRKRKKAKHAVTLLKPSSPFSECFRVIRTRVLQSAKERSARVIFITSTVPKEGKSFVASNLAVSIANGLDQPVLLIDADFRKPSLHATFGFGETRGLSDFLGDERYQLNTMIQDTSFPRLSVLPAGSCAEGSSELLASDVMKVFVQHVKYEDEERYIIVDGPPSQISETLALSEVTDSTVVVVRAGSGDRRAIKRTVDSIGPNNILGIVLNHSSAKRNSYYHYYKKAR